jgi:D-xylose transport system substrate-binding protein
MTVYKPIRQLAVKAAEIAVGLARKEPLTEPTRPLANGFKDVPSILIEPIVVDKNNLASTVIADGFHTLEQVYAGVPRDQWPTP